MDENEERKDGKLWWKAATAVLGFIVLVMLFFFLKEIFSSKEEPPIPYGVFTAKPSFDESSVGRGNNDLQNVAIFLKSTSKQATEQWVINMKKQRKTDNDLPVYIYPETNNKTGFRPTETRAKEFHNVHTVWVRNSTDLYSALRTKPQLKYVIECEDTHFIGSDFADFYFFGQKVMNLDEKIDCVCGGSIHQSASFFQPSQGDVFWLMDHEYCDLGYMKRRESFEKTFEESLNAPIPTCLRSEVPRVSLNQEYVTRMSFNVGKMDPSLFTIAEFSKRMDFDLKTAKSMHKLDWNDLKRQDDQVVYKFPFSGSDDLNHYFENTDKALNIMNFKMYNSTIPLFVDGRKVYIVSESEDDQDQSLFFLF